MPKKRSLLSRRSDAESDWGTLEGFDYLTIY
ncbi:hypothetical protein SAMN05421755_11254 [Nitrosomonas sp. Nm33]|nr:hypothetical protein SAMN05421755_11254 [Nitrosomonas sp. Nm33]